MGRGRHALVVLALLAGPASPGSGHATAATGAAWARVAPVGVFGEETARVGPPLMGSALASASPLVDDGALLAVRGMGERPEKRKEKKPADPEAAPRTRPRARPHVLSAQRVRVMLQSLTVPGWGEASLGERRSALAFGLLEVGIWGSYTAFRIQETMRQKTYERTARLFAGIDVSARDEEFRRVVGFYLSSDEYNRLVVRRDATNLYFGDPAAYAAYVAEHELKGGNTWSWESVETLLRYRAERQATQRAVKRAHDALAAAVINRLLSMIHASAGAVRQDAARTSWRLECVPAGDDPTAYRLGMRADF